MAFPAASRVSISELLGVRWQVGGAMRLAWGSRFSKVILAKEYAPAQVAISAFDQ